MKNIFNSVRLKKPQRSMFDLSHDVKLTCQMGQLIPSLVIEAVPGDSFQISCEALVRFAPLISPVMHRVNVFMHYFFVPNRLVWSGWEDYITQQPHDGVPPVHPYIPWSSSATPEMSKFLSYFGLPKTEPTGTINLNALPFAAYQKIYNDYYRDQNLIAEVDTELAEGSNPGSTLWVQRIRAWEHDYFTAALPWAQKGQDVDIPIGDINFKGGTGPFNQSIARDVSSGNPISAAATPWANAAGGFMTAGGAPAFIDNSDALVVDATTINDLRRAFRLQEWFERQARGGTRYIESILAHFGVRSSDARLQRPEYITGTKAPIMISEVLNTTGQVDGVPQATMAGHGVGVTRGGYGSFFCEEHGYIIGILSIVPRTAYQDGVPKHLLKIGNPFDYYWPEFALIGEQEVKNVEVYHNHTTPDGTFGYVPRYAEYKYSPSRVAGDFQDTLAFWHIGRIFDTDPQLNQEFVECVPRTDIFAVDDPAVDNMYVHIFHQVKAKRPMPYYGDPSF